MVEYQTARLDRVFAALADPTRRAIVERLASADRMRVTDIAARFPISLNAVSKHLKVLEASGLLRRSVEGRTHYCTLAPDRLAASTAWIDRQRLQWERRLDALERMFAQEHRAARPARRRARARP